MAGHIGARNSEFGDLSDAIEALFAPSPAAEGGSTGPT